jgi:hypothetical protein
MYLFTRNRPGARGPAAAARVARPRLAALAAMTVAGIALSGAAPAYAADDAAPAAADTSVSCPSAECRSVFDRTDATDGEVDSTGRNLYVTDSTTGALYRKNLDTGQTKTVATGLGYKTVLADDNTAYNVAYGDDQVRRIDLTTGKVDVVTTLPNPTDIELDGKGNAYISTAQGSHKLYRLNLATKQTTVVADGSYYMYGVALDGKGHAYVSELGDGGHLYEVDLSDNTKREIPGGAYSDFFISDSGQAYGIRSGVGELHRINLADGTTEKVATGLGSAVSIRSDRAGGVFVSSAGDGNVWHIPDLETQDAKVDLHPVSHVTAVPGGTAWPRLKVTNSGHARIGNQDVTLKLGPAGVSWGFNVVYQDRDGNLVETPCRVVDGDAGTSVCKDVPLNLEPGQSVELRTEVNTDKSLKPGDMPSITWQIADKSAKTDWLMK